MVLEPIVLRSGALSPDEQKANKPGGPANPITGARGWLRYLIVLQRAHAVHVARSGGGDGVRGGADREQLVLDALRGAPEPVALHDLDPDTGHLRTLNVYPKSYHALTECHKLDLKLGFLTAAVETARSINDGAASLDIIQRGLDAITYHYGLLVWAVTTPGPGLPWDENDARPVLPERVTALSPLDVYAVAAAYQRVNNARLVALEGLLTSSHGGEGKPTRASWAVFFAVSATELGVRPETLLREWSLGSVLSAMRLSRDARADAQEPARDARIGAHTTEVYR